MSCSVPSVGQRPHHANRSALQQPVLDQAREGSQAVLPPLRCRHRRLKNLSPTDLCVLEDLSLLLGELHDCIGSVHKRGLQPVCPASRTATAICLIMLCPIHREANRLGSPHARPDLRTDLKLQIPSSTGQPDTSPAVQGDDWNTRCEFWARTGPQLSCQ